MGLPVWKNVNFSISWTYWFYSLERRFIVVEYCKRHFPGLYFLKKESGKNGHFWTKTMSKVLWKNDNFLSFWTSCVYSVERRFLVVEYRKRHFAGLYCLKKKSWKLGHFWDINHGSTSLEKCQFLNIWIFCFYSLERRFFCSRIS